MSRSLRFFEIIQILRQSDKPVIASTLAERLEVNIRTIYRDIASLQASSIPIEGEAGIGYVMQKGFDMPPLAFTQEELEAISLGLSFLGRSGDKGLLKTVDTIRSKISSTICDELSEPSTHHASQWHQIPDSKFQPETLRTIIRTHEEIEICYLDLEGNYSTRTLQPIGLFYYIDVIVLLAWCKLRNDFRHFRIDRIQTLEMTGIYFTSKSKTLREKWEAKQKTEMQ